MATEEQREAINVVLRFYEAFNNRRPEVLMELLEKQHVDHTYFGRRAVDPQAIGRMISGFWGAFPDWQETIDEIVPGEGGEITVRATGRGTQAKTFMGREPSGRQVAVPLINILRIRNGKIKEYRSTFPFTLPDEEAITAVEDVQEARAEQGGFRVAAEEWRTALRDFAEERMDSETLAARKAELSQESARCQALLEDSLRRCQNSATLGSLYCSVHESAGYGA
jgi:predicted ester cyclase